jgi:hypothetical protein
MVLSRTFLNDPHIFCIFTTSAFTSFGPVACVEDIPFGSVWIWAYENGVDFGVGVSHMGYPSTVCLTCFFFCILSLLLVSGHGEEFRAFAWRSALINARDLGSKVGVQYCSPCSVIGASNLRVCSYYT